MIYKNAWEKRYPIHEEEIIWGYYHDPIKIEQFFGCLCFRANGYQWFFDEPKGWGWNSGYYLEHIVINS